MKQTIKSKSVVRRRRPTRARVSAKARGLTKIKTILVPIDFSPASLYPIRWAKFIAAAAKATIHFVHVQDFGYPISSAPTAPIISSEAELADRLRRDLEAIVRREKVERSNIHLRSGQPFEQICRLAEEIQANLIVLSTHGRTGWERALLGSTAERIIRHAPCPVLVARKVARRKVKTKLRRIMVPVDFSKCARQGLRYAIDLAQFFGAELALVNVVQLHHDLPPAVVFTESKLKRWAREVAEAHMAGFIKEANFGQVKFTSAVRMGSPAQKISRYAQKIGADMIVTSTHGRTGLPHVLIGSNAEQIVRYAKSPVLVVPTREGK